MIELFRPELEHDERMTFVLSATSFAGDLN